MYLEYWGLKKYPFDNVPDPGFLYMSSEYEEALSRLTYAIEHNKGGMLLTGEIGCGKTLLSRVLVQQHKDELVDIALINNPSLTPLDFISEVLYQFGISVPSDKSKSEMLKALDNRLMSNYKQHKTSLLVIDEAQSVYMDTFEEIRMLLNFQLNDRLLLNILFIGQPELREIIAGIKQLNQRIAMRYHINPLSRSDITEYILFRLQKAGITKQIFSDDALEKICVHSQGIPRKINHICDLALLIGAGLHVSIMDGALIDRVYMKIHLTNCFIKTFTKSNQLWS